MKKFVAQMGSWKVTQVAKRFWRDEAGQSTTEYILILSIVVMVAMRFKSTFMGKMEQATGSLGNNITNIVDQNSQF